MISKNLLTGILVVMVIKVLFAIAIASSTESNIDTLSFLNKIPRVPSGNRITPEMRLTAVGFMFFVDIVILIMYANEYRRLRRSPQNDRDKRMLDATLGLMIAATACSGLFYLYIVFIVGKNIKLNLNAPALSASVLFLSAVVSAVEYTLLRLCDE